jgi:hypothetical protein
MGADLNCGQEIVRTAGDQARREFVKICEVAFESISCSSKCTLDAIFGEDMSEAMLNLSKKRAMERLEERVKTVANKHVAKFVPVAGAIDTYADAIGTVVCTTDCVKSQ